MTSDERKRIGALKRRHARLSERLAEPWNGSPGGLHRTKAERAALAWAIDIIESAFGDDEVTVKRKFRCDTCHRDDWFSDALVAQLVKRNNGRLPCGGPSFTEGAARCPGTMR